MAWGLTLAKWIVEVVSVLYALHPTYHHSLQQRDEDTIDWTVAGSASAMSVCVCVSISKGRALWWRLISHVSFGHFSNLHRHAHERSATVRGSALKAHFYLGVCGANGENTYRTYNRVQRTEL